jgi:acetyl-CoA carboxylase carboxyl transferase subunit alpha
MLENSVYSVISPEGCSSILWKDTSKTAEAAEALKMTASDMLKIDVIDKIIPEPIGGAHRHHSVAINNTGDAIEDCLKILSNFKYIF